MIIDINELIDIAQQAGQLILAIYHQPFFETKLKSDESPLTQADIQSHLFISDALKKRYPTIPILSEEASEYHDFETRKKWDYFFLVDPLDGTKEFIKRNGEFTVNIALIKKNEPVAGVIHAPALNITYYAEKDKGAYKINQGESIRLPGAATSSSDKKIRAVVSRSHACEKTKEFLAVFDDKEIVNLSVGSALKFGLIAEGEADIYPRWMPTMEWDTAAGHLLVNETGNQLWVLPSREPLEYNKVDLRNPGFVVLSPFISVIPA